MNTSICSFKAGIFHVTSVHLENWDPVLSPWGEARATQGSAWDIPRSLFQPMRQFWRKFSVCVCYKNRRYGCVSESWAGLKKPRNLKSVRTTHAKRAPGPKHPSTKESLPSSLRVESGSSLNACGWTVNLYRISCFETKKQEPGFSLTESGPCRAVHLSIHKWPGGLVN